MPTSPELLPLQDADWPAEIADMLPGFAGGLNVYRTMAHHPALLRAWAPLREHIVNHSALGPERAELVILRVGRRLESPYEWGQHVVRARERGLSDARIRSIWGDLRDMAPDDAVLAYAVDEVLDTGRLSPGGTGRLTRLVGPAGVLDLFATVGFYSTLGFILNSYDTPLDDDIAATLDREPLV